MGPAGAVDEPLQGRVYRPLDESPYQVSFNREIDFSLIVRSAEDEDLYWGEGEEDYDTFALLWDEEEFNSHLELGETEFTLTGAYGLSERSSPELVELWNGGLVTLPDPPRLLVQIRPRDFVTVYSIQDEEIQWTVRKDTPFADAVRYQDTVTLRPAEGANPYGDPAREDFLVIWDREEYEAGLESGAERFLVSGAYGEPEWEAMRGWVRAEGTAQAVVLVEEGNQPLVYRDPFVDELGGLTCTAYVLPDTSFDELKLTEEQTLRLVGGGYQDTRRFALLWDRSKFEADMGAGEDIFSLPGQYGPHALWTAGEKDQWADGEILVDMPAPEAVIRVVRAEKFPFQADVRINRYGDLGPCFLFPWIAGMEEAALAWSTDGVSWQEEVWTWEDLPSDQRQRGRVELTVIAEGEDGSPAVTQDTAVVYVKMGVTGSSLAGETAVYELKPTADGWDMTPRDDSGGDHGGGGQGQHDRPGREDAESGGQNGTVTEPEASEEPEPQEPDHSGSALKPGITWPSWPWPVWLPAGGTFPALAPELSAGAEPEADLQAPIPWEEPVSSDRSEEPGAAPPPEGGQSAPGTEAPAPPAETEEKAPPLTVEPEEPAQTGPEPPGPDQQTAGPEPAPQGSHIPGFAAAAGLTAAAVLCGALWFRRRQTEK